MATLAPQIHASVAELADAPGLGPGALRGLRVRVPPLAPTARGALPGAPRGEVLRDLVHARDRRVRAAREGHDPGVELPRALEAADVAERLEVGDERGDPLHR